MVVGQREINANFSGNRLYACPNRVRVGPRFSYGPISQRSYRKPSIDLIHYPYSRQVSKNEGTLSADGSRSGRALRESLSFSLSLSSRGASLPQRSAQRTPPAGRLPLEAGVSICHINKVNPSPNRKPFPPARVRLRRPQKIPLARLVAGRGEELPRLSEEKLTRAADSGRKGGGERKDRIDETSN